MGVTIKDIADLAGVSRGTVDRVLHNRYGVKPEIRARVEKILEEVNYKPNIVAQALKRSENPLEFGFVVTDISNPFWLGIVQGFRQAEKEYEPYGVKLHRVDMKEISPAEQLRCIYRLLDGETKIHGLFVAGINSPEVSDHINKISQQIPVITYNTDIANCSRLCFVGQNHIAAGHAAGRLMSMLLDQDGEVATFSGPGKTLAHSGRFQGFVQSMRDLRPNTVILDPVQYHEVENDVLTFDELGYEMAVAALKNPRLKGLYVTGEGSSGVAKALKESGRRPEVKMICYDMLPGVVQAIREDIIDFTIGQEEYLQGYLPVKLMYEYKTFGTRPPVREWYTDIDIRVKENIDYRGYRLPKRIPME